MIRVVIAALVAAAVSSSARADGRGMRIGKPEVAAKSATAKDIASALAEKGLVRVLVVVAPSSGASLQDVSDAVGAASTREAAKQLVARTLDILLSAHKLSHVGGAKGAPAIVRLTTVPAFSALVDESELTALAKDARVVAVEYDRPMQKHLAVTAPLIGMPSVHAAGGTGAGYTIAHIDDGIQRNHPFLGVARIAPGREACFLATNDCPNGANEQIGVGAGAAARYSPHGTHTAGVAIGNRVSGTPNKGVAPAAKIAPVNIFGFSSSTYFSTIQRAFEYIEDLALLKGGSNPLRIASLVLSAGGDITAETCDADPAMAPLKRVVDNLRSKGVLPVASSGNGSHTNGMVFPACISTIVSVAATHRDGAFSIHSDISRSTDLLAPGGGSGDKVVSSVLRNAFDGGEGTSIAAAHVAGAAAVLKQVRPTASACRIEEALKSTGLPTADPRSGPAFVKPRIRVDLARARLLAPTAPPHNSFAAAKAIPANATRYSADSTNVSANLETGEPHHVVSTAQRSIWWKWTPSSSGPVIFDTIGSGVDTVLAVYRGAQSVTRLGKLVVWNDNISTTEHASRARFTAAAGETYHIVVAGKTAAEQCSVTLNLARPPANDNFVDAQLVDLPASARALVDVSNVLATKERGEPDHDGHPNATSSVWYKFTAPVAGPITLSTERLVTPGIDTVLAVYTGSAVDALTRVASDDDSGQDFLSSVTFDMTQGAVYRVAVAGFGDARGLFRLRFSPAGVGNIGRANVMPGD
jgi:serine protease